MKLLQKLKSWLFGPPVAEVFDADDLMMQLVVSRAFATGNIVIANRRDDGGVEVEEIPLSDNLLSEDQHEGS